jgi:hypothetical protein
MIKSFSNLFRFLRPDRTQQTRQRQQNASSVASTATNIQLCQQLINELNKAELEVLSSLENPETAWPFLTELRQLKRQTQQDLLSLAPNASLVTEQFVDTSRVPVRTVKTRTGSEWRVFNGGQVH